MCWSLHTSTGPQVGHRAGFMNLTLVCNLPVMSASRFTPATMLFAPCRQQKGQDAGPIRAQAGIRHGAERHAHLCAHHGPQLRAAGKSRRIQRKGAASFRIKQACSLFRDRSLDSMHKCMCHVSCCCMLMLCRPSLRAGVQGTRLCAGRGSAVWPARHPVGAGQLEVLGRH